MNPPPPPEAAAATQEPVAQPAPVAGLVLLFFLVLATVGMLRPIRNSFALDGLPDREFYTVYFVSALVVFFVPAYQRLARRVPWRTLIPGLAGLFALCLVGFRLLYREGSPAFGLAFYGWYDLFSAALVTQFFLLAQGFFDARSAKSAYPRVIAGGALGATTGGALTGFLAPHVGTPRWPRGCWWPSRRGCRSCGAGRGRPGRGTRERAVDGWRGMSGRSSCSAIRTCAGSRRWSCSRRSSSRWWTTSSTS